ncbi:MAG: hypothetical protein JW818_12355 [Pirellulales bacterium]|nr:hypothetical protein [Pirellulales bacterium]
MRTITITTILLGLLASPGFAPAGTNDVPRKVQEGLERFEAGQFKEASEAFDQAGDLKPDDPRILFDQACAKAAAGETDPAVELLTKAAVTENAALAARCHYNLGLIAAQKAKTRLGEKPEEAEPAARTEALEDLARAVAHWRDCLASEPDHADARHNIELVRSWTRAMQQTWKDRDRQKLRDSMKLPEYLKWLEEQQRTLRKSTKELEPVPKSPKQHLAVHRATLAQRDLRDETEPLKAKIAQGLTAPPAPAGVPGTCNMPGGACSMPAAAPAPAIPPEEKEKAIKLLGGLADSMGQSMQTAAEHLTEQSLPEAVTQQADAIEKVDQIGTVLTPYPDLVHRAVAKQEGLVKDVKSSQSGGTGVSPVSSQGESQKNEANVMIDAPSPPAPLPKGEASLDGTSTEKAVDLPETAWDQRFVERWTPVLVAKAKQGLKNLPPAPEKKDKEADPNEPAAPGATGVSPAQGQGEDKHWQDASATQDASKEETKKPVDPQQAAAEATQKQQEDLRKSMEKAIELGPKIHELTAAAARDLDEERPDEALPKQEEALRLLREIAEPLKQPNQNQCQNKQQNQDKNKQDQKDKDKNKDNKNQDQKNNQDKKDQDKNKDDKKDQNKDKQDPGKDQQDKTSPPSAGQDQQKQKPEEQKAQQRQVQPRDLSKEQAKALMRQVQQRQREKEKADKALRLYMSRPAQVDKDW